MSFRRSSASLRRSSQQFQGAFRSTLLLGGFGVEGELEVSVLTLGIQLNPAGQEQLATYGYESHELRH